MIQTRPRNIPISLRSRKANRFGRSLQRRSHRESKNLSIEWNKGPTPWPYGYLIFFAMDYPWHWWLGDILCASDCYLRIGDDEHCCLAVDDDGEWLADLVWMYIDIGTATVKPCIYRAYYSWIPHPREETELLDCCYLPWVYISMKA